MRDLRAAVGPRLAGRGVGRFAARMAASGSSVLSDDLATAAGRQIGLSVALLTLVARAVDGAWSWLVAGLALVFVLVAGSRAVPARTGPLRTAPTHPLDLARLLVPAVLAAATIGAVRLAPVGIVSVAVGAVVGLAVERTLALERRLATLPGVIGPDDRAIVTACALVAAFVGFVGVGALVPGGLADAPGAASAGIGTGGPALGRSALAALVAGDSLVALLLGYRFARLRLPAGRRAWWVALSSGLVVAIGAGSLRLLGIPHLLGPALLTVLLFLWESYRGAEPERRRDPRWIWEIGLIAILGTAVVVLNLQLG